MVVFFSLMGMLNWFGIYLLLGRVEKLEDWKRRHDSGVR